MLCFQVDVQSHDGQTALGLAAAAGHLDIVTMLSQHRAKVAVCHCAGCVSFLCYFLSPSANNSSSHGQNNVSATIKQQMLLIFIIKLISQKTVFVGLFGCKLRIVS